jgi:hypothetical protein
VRLIDLFFVSIYSHFLAMRERGRNIIPWFQTDVAISLFLAISIAMFAKVIFGGSFNQKNVSEITFLMIFMLTGVICFFSIKHYFFDSGRHIKTSEIYLVKYSSKKKLLIKTISIFTLLIIPVILGYIIYVNAS